MADKQAGTNGIKPVETDIQTTADVATWEDGAPRGGRAVMNRVLKDGAKVPMFFGQTLIRSLRDQGYSSTTSALCEIIDNAIQWSAENIHIYFRQTGGRGPTRSMSPFWMTARASGLTASSRIRLPASLTIRPVSRAPSAPVPAGRATAGQPAGWRRT
ncbi:hypothetical protein [Komagataeibacter xylinus]|uniref:hypothetical protein n=1 Tax=Komagataeibacter xylinus TaxID=28448 RepID=UPI001031D86A|nr:hypothetical protein [Komagataeibacter xylinus]